MIQNYSKVVSNVNISARIKQVVALVVSISLGILLSMFLS